MRRLEPSPRALDAIANECFAMAVVDREGPGYEVFQWPAVDYLPLPAGGVIVSNWFYNAPGRTLDDVSEVFAAALDVLRDPERFVFHLDGYVGAVAELQLQQPELYPAAGFLVDEWHAEAVRFLEAKPEAWARDPLPTGLGQPQRVCEGLLAGTHDEDGLGRLSVDPEPSPIGDGPFIPFTFRVLLADHYRFFDDAGCPLLASDDSPDGAVTPERRQRLVQSWLLGDAVTRERMRTELADPRASRAPFFA